MTKLDESSLKGMITTTVVDMRLTSNNDWLVKVKNKFEVSPDLERWETVEYEAIAIDKDPTRAYQIAVTDIVNQLNKDDEDEDSQVLKN
jgi:L-lysine 2,3-aminomutase